MAVVKVIEIIAESSEGWDAAAKEAVKEAAKTLSGIQSIYIENMQGIVEGDKIVKYRVDAKVSFLVQD
ncbi:MAG TPA: dodecin family protein [Clostridiaceae bacterium]